MLVKFKDRIYAKSQIGILVWDFAFQNFRPCEKIVWNPIKKEIEPLYGIYTSEIFDKNYGYGEHRDFCINFTDRYISQLESAIDISDPDVFWKWTEQKLEWTGDRGITLHPCHQTIHKEDYYRILNLRRKTYKKLPRQIRGTFKQRNNKIDKCA
jgi:hypothetical protein